MKSRSMLKISTPMPLVMSAPSCDTAVTSTQPCPGLSELDNSEIAHYLTRSGLTGGGHSVNFISEELFGKAFGDLLPNSKDEVVNAQMHSHKWRNDHQHLQIFSTECEKTVKYLPPLDQALPCDSCMSILKLKSFKSVLQKKTPITKNAIFTNTLFQNQVLGKVYAWHVGLQETIDALVRFIILIQRLYMDCCLFIFCH